MSLTQLLFGCRQRTSLLLLPFQNKPINFHNTAISKDKFHATSRTFHEQHKVQMTPLHPGQRVHIQDTKTSLWNSFGIILSIRLDKLSYNVLIADQTFIRPLCLLRPSSHEYLSPSSSASAPDQITPPALRRSARLHSCAHASLVRSSLHSSPVFFHHGTLWSHQPQTEHH